MCSYPTHIQIQTSKGRTLYYGTFLTFFQRLVNVISFDVKEMEEIVGLFYDPTTSQPRFLHTLGMTLELGAGPSARDGPLSLCQRSMLLILFLF